MGKPYSFEVNREPFEFMKTAREKVASYIFKMDLSPDRPIYADDVSIIWFTTNDAEWRVLLGTTLGDGLYYRITHNGEETRLDVFKMFDSQTISNKDND